MKYLFPFWIGLMVTVVGLVGCHKIPRLVPTFSAVTVVGCVIMVVATIVVFVHVIREYREDKDA